MAKARLTKNPPCTISPDLWKVWKANKGKGDVEAIMALADKKGLPKSKPVITQSLLYGFCNNDGLRNLITKYFVDKNVKLAEERGKEEKQIALLKSMGTKKK